MDSDDPCDVYTVCRYDSDVLSEAGMSHNVCRQSSLHCAEVLQNLIVTITILSEFLNNNVTILFIHIVKLTLLQRRFSSSSYPKPETLTPPSSF